MPIPDSCSKGAEAGISGRIAADGTSILVDSEGLSTFPKTIKADFKEGKLGKDGVMRKGKVIITSTNRHEVVGSVHTAVIKDYYQNGYKIVGINCRDSLYAQLLGL